jgi:hypothetical protein
VKELQNNGRKTENGSCRFWLESLPIWQFSEEQRDSDGNVTYEKFTFGDVRIVVRCRQVRLKNGKLEDLDTKEGWPCYLLTEQQYSTIERPGGNEK